MQMDYIRGGTQKDQYSAADVVTWPCPLCGSENESEIKTERAVLRIVNCSSCSLIRVNPRVESPEEVYTGNIDIYRDEYRMVVSGKAEHHRDRNYRKELDMIRRYKPRGKFLDIGTNVGSFLRLARGKNWELTGVEPSENLAKLAREWWGLNIVTGFLENVNLPAKNFDIVTLTDVFEHVVNPREMLANVKKVLKPDGIVYIKVPNGKYNWTKFKLRTLLGRPSDNDFDAYEHVCHYSHETLTRILKENGFEIVKMFVETPVQIPIWHKITGHYYQHESPFILDWKLRSVRTIWYFAALAESFFLRKVGFLGPNIGVIARPKAD